MKKIAYFTKALTITIANLLLLSSSFAQSGSLDLSFKTNGYTTSFIGTSHAYPNSIAIQTDQKILVAGYSSIGGVNYDFTVARYLSNGNLDSTFNANGTVSTPIGLTEDKAYAIAIQSDGKIVLVGETYVGSNYHFAIVRYNSDGSLDTSFDTDGIVTSQIGATHAYARSVIIQNDGKIVVAGYASLTGANYDFTVARYNTDGSFDTSFDTDGVVLTAIDTNEDRARSVSLQSDGKIVVTGESKINGIYQFATARYNTDGSLDNSFDNDGKVITAIAGATDDNKPSSVNVQSDGKIVVVGETTNSTYHNFALVRYNTNGSLDNSFDTDGIVTSQIGATHAYGSSVVIQGDGKIILAGYASLTGANYDFALARYNTNGSLDTTFDTDGLVLTPIGADEDRGRAIALQSDGKIVVAGETKSSNAKYRFGVARYLNTISTTSLHSISTQKSFSVYPNPTRSHLTILSKELNINYISIVDITGKTLKTVVPNSNTINVSDLVNGIYILQIQTEKGLFNHKFIKE